MRRLQQSQWFARSLAEVFGFFAAPANLERITPPWLNFRILTPTPLSLQAGSLIDYRIKLRGIPVCWQTEITNWQPSHQFIDVQKKGPYRSWRHPHRFEERDGGTWVHDILDYQAPGGWLEPLVNRQLVARDLRRIFEYRQQCLANLLPS